MPLTLMLLLLAPLQDRNEVQIKSHKLTDSVTMLTGQGGNLAVLAGEDGVILIDDQFARLTDKIREAIGKINEAPIKFVINTHWHGDHTGGNENFGKAGSVIVAHENVRKRMSVEQFMKMLGRTRTVPASPKGALPVITFPDRVSFHLNGEELEVFHVPHAHTDGDSIIHFKTSNVVHMGDVFFNGRYPFIDLSSGGSIQGMIDAVEAVVKIADGKTQIIPGHGAVGTVEDLKKYGEVLRTAKREVGKLVTAGKTLEEVKEAKPLSETDAEWGGGFINPDRFLESVYTSLKPKKKE